MNHKSFQRYIDDILERPEKIIKSALAAITPKKKTVGADKKEVGISWHDIVRRDDIKQWLVNILPHLWEGKYQFAFEYSMSQRKNLS